MRWRPRKHSQDMPPTPQSDECDAFLVLLNPAARLVVPNAVADEEVARRLQALGVRCSIVRTTSEEEARQQAAEAARSGEWRAVVAAGGDGTIHAVAEGLLQGQAGRKSMSSGRAGESDDAPPVALGILPLGTMNNIAHSLGIPEDLGAACDILAHTDPRPLDVATANGHFFIEVAGIGAEAGVTEQSDAVKGNLLSQPGAIVALARRLAQYRPHRVTLDIDGRRLRMRALQVNVLNAPRYGMGFTAAPDARMDDGLLDIVVYERVRWWELPSFYLSMIGGGSPRGPRVRTLRGQTIGVRPDHTAWPVHVDGTVKSETPVEVRVQHGALRVLAPPPGERTDPRAEDITPVEVVLRATASPATTAAAHAALTAATRAGDVVATSTESALQALGTSSEEAREAIGVEPPHRGVHRARLVLAGYLFAFGSAILTTLAVRQANLLPGDLQITRAFQRTRSPRADMFWRAVAAPGFPRVSTPLVAVASTGFWLLGLRLEAVFVTLASGTNFLNYLLKHLVKRERPTHTLVHVARVINEPGFPSGHVMHYLSFFGFLGAAALANLRPSRIRTALVGACGAMIGLVGPSRVYLGAHWPSDVAAGYLYGGIYLGALLQAYTWAKERAWLAQRSRRARHAAPEPPAASTTTARPADSGRPAWEQLRAGHLPQIQLVRLLRRH